MPTVTVEAAGEQVTVDYELPPAVRTLVGMSYGDFGDPADLEALVPGGRHLGAHRLYFQYGDKAKMLGWAKRDLDAGRIPLYSFKVQHGTQNLLQAWQAGASGQLDGWWTDMAGSLADLVRQYPWAHATTMHHHEPENDLKDLGVPTFGPEYQAWVQMNARLGPITRATQGLKQALCYTGYPEVFDGPTYPIDKFYPGDDACDIIGFDPYLLYGTGSVTKWTTPSVGYLPKLLPFVLAHGKQPAVFETGLVDAAWNDSRGKDWLRSELQYCIDNGFYCWSYYDSTLNSIGSWTLGNIPAKKQAFANVVPMGANPVLIGV